MILIDAGVLIAAVNAKDSHHAEAQGLLREVESGRWGSALVPDYVLAEVASWVVRKRGTRQAKKFVVAILEGKDISLLPCSEHLSAFLPIFLNQRGTRLSLTDAAVVGLARLTGFRNVATFDSDFRAFSELRVIDRPGMAA